MSLTFTVNQLVGLLGGWSIILIAVSGWTGRLFAERLLSKWRRDEQTSVESIRNSLANDRLLLESAIRSFQAGQDANHEKRLAAVEELWTDVLHLRDKFSEVVLFYDILLPGEYDAVYKKGGALGAAISTVDEKFINDAMRPVEMLERQRPYLGETLWLRFFIYRAFFGRLAFLINDGKRRDHIQNWKEDSGVRQLLSPAISSEMLSSVLETKNPTTIRIAINALEAPMLEEISLIVSGRRSAFESFKNAKDLQASLAEVVEQRRLC